MAVARSAGQGSLLRFPLPVALPPDGTYFVLADVRPLGETDGRAFCRRLPVEAGVVDEVHPLDRIAAAVAAAVNRKGVT